MPKGKRTPEASADDLALFASFVRSEERKAKDEKRRARDERRQAGEHQRLVQAKDAAAAEVKRLRSSDRATAEQRAAADDAYRRDACDCGQRVTRRRFLGILRHSHQT